MWLGIVGRNGKAAFVVRTTIKKRDDTESSPEGWS